MTVETSCIQLHTSEIDTSKRFAIVRHSAVEDIKVIQYKSKFLEDELNVTDARKKNPKFKGSIVRAN